MVGVAVAAFAGCTQSYVTSEASSDAASAQKASEQVSRMTGPTVLAKCNEVQPAALQYYAECPNPATEASASVAREILCVDLLLERHALYPQCLEAGAMVISLAPSPPPPPPPTVVPEDFEAYADTTGNFFDDLDDLDEGKETESVSQISSTGGTKTATQTSGTVKVEVSSEGTHEGLPKF
jgi:hypothetical protein